MYNLIITRESTYDNSDSDRGTGGEIVIYKCETVESVEKVLRDYTMEHLFTVRNDSRVFYGDLSYILIHNGSVVSELNNTSVFDVLNLTPFTYSTNIVSDVYETAYKHHNRNTSFLKNFLLQEKRTFSALKEKYATNAREIEERKKLKELLAKYPDMVDQNGK